MRLIQGSTLAALVCFGLTGPAAQAQVNENYVVQIYRDLVGRQASSGEVEMWARLLYTGETTHDHFRARVLGSEEYFRRVGRDGRRFLTAMFAYMYGRQPTERDLDYWRSRWDASGSREAVAYEMLQAASQPVPEDNPPPPPREEYRRDDSRRYDERRYDERPYEIRRYDERRYYPRNYDIRR